MGNRNNSTVKGENDMKFNVTVTRYGCVDVEANSSLEAMRIVNENYKTDDISWSDDWDATDADEIDE